MIFAAGLGTRLKPFTNLHPKALAPVNQKPLLQRNIEYLSAFGIRDIIVNVHHFADQVIGFLDINQNFGCNISISHEVEEPLETVAV
jgi:MurNAc alpha-1-phosphate uridylyltransferase